MMKAQTLYQIALKQVPQPKMKQKTLFQKGLTSNIIQAITQVFLISWKQTSQFAKNFQKQNLALIHQFVVENISYIIDAKGIQKIKEPAVTIFSKVGDCKAYSILIASILQNLGIPFVFRFVKFKGDTEFSHVYIVTYKGIRRYDNQIEKDFVLDACLPYPNLEKPYIEKLDVMPNTTQIVQVSGIGCGSDYYNVKGTGIGAYDATDFFENEYDTYNYYDYGINYYNEIPQVGGFFDSIKKGFQNFGTFVKDKVFKPITKLTDPFLPAALSAFGVPPNVTQAAISIRNKVFFGEGEIKLDMATIQDGAQLLGVDTDKGIFAKTKKIAGKVMNVVDKVTGKPLAIQVKTASDLIKLPLDEQVQIMAQLSQEKFGEIYKNLSDADKKLLDGAMLAVEKGKGVFQDYVLANPTNGEVKQDTNKPTKSSNSTGLFVGSAIALYFLMQGKGKRK